MLQPSGSDRVAVAALCNDFLLGYSTPSPLHLLLQRPHNLFSVAIEISSVLTVVRLRCDVQHLIILTFCIVQSGNQICGSKPVYFIDTWLAVHVHQKPFTPCYTCMLCVEELRKQFPVVRLWMAFVSEHDLVQRCKCNVILIIVVKHKLYLHILSM